VLDRFRPKSVGLHSIAAWVWQLGSAIFAASIIARLSNLLTCFLIIFCT